MGKNVAVFVDVANIFYAAKAAAARESSRIAQIEQDIRENGQRVRLLRAEVARLEQPARLESLSRQIGMAPVAVARQAKEGQLTALKPVPAQPAASAPAAAPAPAAVADDAPVPTPSPEPAQGAFRIIATTAPRRAPIARNDCKAACRPSGAG